MAASAVTPRQAVYAHLQADPNVSGLVGGRIYHITPPLDATYPLITINTVSNVDRRDLSGVSYTETRIQVTAMAATLKEAEAIAMAVRQSLEGFQGMMAGALPVLECQVVGYLPVFEEEVNQVHYHVDIMVIHEGGV